MHGSTGNDVYTASCPSAPKPMKATLAPLIKSSLSLGLRYVRFQPERGYLTANKFAEQHRQSIVSTLFPPVFDRHVSAFDVTGVI